MRVLAFSDLHRDLEKAARLTEMAGEADVVIGAGDFAVVHEGLEEMIGALRAITQPTLLVPGNNETEKAMREAAIAWDAATVLHGESAQIGGVQFFGLGAGVPVTPWDWSFDLDDEAASRMMEPCPEGAVMVLHSPPKDACDTSGDGKRLGSPALREAIEAKRPQLVVCGHIHEAWGERDTVGGSPVANLGPDGAFFDL